MRPTQRFSIYLGDPDTTHITSFYKIGNGTNSIFHRDVRIDTCWLIEVNIICA